MKKGIYSSVLQIVAVIALFAITGGSFLNAQISCKYPDLGPDSTIGCGDTSCFALYASFPFGNETSSYSVDPIPYVPFSFSSGTIVPAAIDDRWSSVIPIGFDFCFYGNTFNQCVIGTNGVISFDIANAGNYNTWPINAAIPSPIPADLLNSIMFPWQDVDPSLGGTISWDTAGTAPCRVFIVSFENVPMYICNTDLVTQQVVLYEGTNIIEMYIKDKPLCASWNGGAAIQGIQDATGTNATVVPGRNYPTQWSASNDAWRFTPSGPSSTTFTWYQDGNQIQTGATDSLLICPSATTEYMVVASALNCQGNLVFNSDTIVINLIQTAAFSIADSAQDVSCFGGNDGSVILNVSGPGAPFSYYWTGSGDSTAFQSGLTAGSYTVYVYDSSGCFVLDTINIAEPPVLQLGMVSYPETCIDSGAVKANVIGGTPGYQYLWDNGTTLDNQTGLVSGWYYVTVTDSNGCIISDSAFVEAPEYPAINLDDMAEISCYGSSDAFIIVSGSGGNGNYTYTWDNGLPDGTFQKDLGPGTYTVIMTDSLGCMDTLSITFQDPPEVIAAFSSVPAIPVELALPDASISLTNLSSNATSYTWIIGAGDTIWGVNPVYQFWEEGEYCVTMIAANDSGCTDTVTACYVIVNPGVLVIPNTFTPNGDGLNDVFTIVGIELYPENTLRIFNRWGNLIYEKASYDNSWEGINGKTGETLPDGAYFYIFDTGNEDAGQIQGDIVIFR